MKIGLVVPYVDRRGTGIFGHHIFLAQELAKYADVKIICTNPTSNTVDGVEVLSPARKAWLPFFLRKAMGKVDVTISFNHVDLAYLATKVKPKHTLYGFVPGAVLERYNLRKMPLDIFEHARRFFNIKKGDILWLYERENSDTNFLAVCEGFDGEKPEYKKLESDKEIEKVKPSFKKSLYNYFYEKALERADFVVLYSQQLASGKADMRSSDVELDRLLKRIYVRYPDELKVRWIEYVPNFVDVDFIEKKIKGTKRVVREKKKLIYVGRLTIRKGIDYVIQAIADLKAEGYDIALDIVGDGEARPYFEYLTEKLGVEKDVKFLGKMPNEDVYRQMKNGDAFVLCSTFGEGVSRAVLEAMACGIPPISTPVGGMPDVVIDGKTGYLIETDSLESSKKAITKMLDKNNVDIMGGNAKNLIKEKNSTKKVAEEYLNLYGRLLA